MTHIDIMYVLWHGTNQFISEEDLIVSPVSAEPYSTMVVVKFG